MAETTTTRTRALPHDLDAERALLGSLLLDERAVAEAISILGDLAHEAFFSEKHQQLYDVIVELWKANAALDGVVLKEALTRRGVFEQLGGFDFLGSLVAAVPTAQRVADYARVVREKCLLRQLIRAGHRVMETAYEDKLPTQEILDAAAKEIFDVTERGVRGGAQPLPELIEEVFERIQDLDGTVLTGERTGYEMLDEMTCGLQSGELIIVAGRPSMGKTALGLNIAEHMALDDGKPVLFFSLEMSRQQVAQRILCSRARVDAHRLRRGRHSADDMRRLRQAADEIRTKPLLVDDTSSLTILELRARARLEHRKHHLRAIFVDYLQLMRAPGSESRQQEVAEISRGLKALAKELNLPVIAMAQLNRKPEDRTGNRPRMSDLRESGAIEQDADLIALLHREAYYRARTEEGTEEDGDAELIIAKQRNGPVGTVHLHFNQRFTRFENPAYGESYADVPEAQAVTEDEDIGF